MTMLAQAAEKGKVKVHDFRRGQHGVIQFADGDWTIHDYGRGNEFGRIRNGHIVAVDLGDVPQWVQAEALRAAVIVGLAELRRSIRRQVANRAAYEEMLAKRRDEPAFIAGHYENGWTL